MLDAEARERVIVALDCDREEALSLADALSGHAKWLKVGMTLYYAEGPSIVRAVISGVGELIGRALCGWRGRGPSIRAWPRCRCHA